LFAQVDAILLTCLCSWNVPANSIGLLQLITTQVKPKSVYARLCARFQFIIDRKRYNRMENEHENPTVHIAFDSPDEMTELVRRFAEDGRQAQLTPALMDDDGRQWFRLTTRPA
jgi:hypothetical protein